MKINGNFDPKDIGKVNSNSVSKVKSDSSSEVSGLVADNSSLVSQLSSKLSEIKAGQPPFDAEKVAQVKAAIAAGEFKISPEAIADKIIKEARELVGN